MSRKKDPTQPTETHEGECCSPSRRRFLAGVGLGAASLAFPHIWLPRKARAATPFQGTVDHLIYIRLSGGFRFTCAFNGDVATEFNPFGQARNVPSGVEWGPSRLLEEASWLNGDDGQARAALGMKSALEITDQMAVVPCVDHEPFAARADGNHGTGLERFYTGYVGGAVSVFTMINYGVRARVEAATANGEVILPAFTMGDSGMAIGAGKYAGYRPPVLQGGGFEGFGFGAGDALPDWADRLSRLADERVRDRVHPQHFIPVDAYMQTREAVGRFADIFTDPVLRISEGSQDVVDGISNQELDTLFGRGAGRNVALALRLFKFGCPAVYLNQGGYDFHSGEENGLPGQMDDLNRVLSGLEVALKKMQHPKGGTYWDRTLVVCGSEFGRTARGSRFNSARGSDHAGDYATRWMSMPMMGGLISQLNAGGKSFGRTKSANLEPEGKVYAYRAMVKTLLDVLGADHSEFFPGDDPIQDFFV